MSDDSNTRTASTVLEKRSADEVTAPTADSEPEKDAPQIAAGQHIDRYIVLDALGAGGMGVVYKAYDPELDRRIALKLHRVRGRESKDSSRARDRLLREAQALAQLSHPNVVAAYDVGTVGEDVFVAMEFVEGQTFKEWLKGRRRSHREIVDVLVAAGRGLAAAHAAGLVHRDFKPDNVLVGDDGRVRVADFGLARAVEDPRSVGGGGDSGEAGTNSPRSSAEDLLAASSDRRIGSQVTQLGTVVGTPGYMAAEQFLGRGLDAHTDQFAFCVTLYEALYGARPFSAKTPSDLKMKVVTGDIDPSPPRRGVPRRLRRIALRGLSVAPEDRYPSMDALLAELSVDSRARVRRWTFAASVLALAGAVMVLSAPWKDRDSQVCRGADAKIASVWGPDVEKEVESAFLGSSRPYASDALARVKQELDRRSRAWAEMRTEACRATRVHGEQSEQVLDMRMLCLDRRLGEMRALITLFARDMDDDVVDHAVRATLELPQLDQCTDVEALLEQTPPPADAATREEVERAREWLDKVTALSGAGKYDQALQISQQVVEDSRRIDYAPLAAEALTAVGWARCLTGSLDEGLATLREAAAVAASARNDRLLAVISTHIYYVVGILQRRYAEASELTALTEAVVVRAGNPASRRSDVLTTKGYVQLKKGEREAARATLEQALALTEEAALPFQAAHAHNLLGNLWVEERDFDKAADHIGQALAIWEKTLGGKHPKIAIALNNLGNVLVEQDRIEDAMKLFERSRDIYETALGPEHPKVAIALLNLGEVASMADQCDRALPQYERALAIVEERYGEEHPYAGVALTGRGQCLVDMGRAAEAVPLLERALAIRAREGAETNGVARARFALARALWDANRDRQRAAKLGRQARAFFREHVEAAKELAKVERWLAQRNLR